MQIQKAILHRIIKERNTSGASSTSTKKREACLKINDHLERTIEEILKIYTRSTNGYGTFNPNQTVHRFPVFLQDHVAEQINFIDFTRESTELIAAKMSDEAFATGGYVLFLRYANLGREWMLVAMLKLKPGTGVNEETLELSETLSFDIEHLHEAARVDLQKWRDDTQPYLPFIKKRQSGDQVSRYFREALGCTEYTDSKHHTGQTLDAFEDYCETNAWPPEQRHEGRRRVYEYYEAKNKADEPVNLTALSAIIDDQNPVAFSDFVRDNGYEIDETFKPHKTTYNRFKRISKTFGSVRVSFDVQDIWDGRVDYDEDNTCLVITNLPDELITEIRKHKPGDVDSTE
ncbi:nucleoid-associated protein [Methylomonas sp. 2BW1-5-20]|uniref:nucleoid-associated protein n=1 Tax=Methylomonas sp. 2BW1-5-20 TaxID=3376686 RepID=UPI0040504263